MKKELNLEVKKLYTRLFMSRRDFGMAATFGKHILKKGWNKGPWARGTIYEQQAAFITALVIFYARPFTQSRGLPRLPTGLLQYDPDEQALHARILTLRHQVYAHTDISGHWVEPYDFMGSPALQITEEQFRIPHGEIKRLLGMIEKVSKALADRMDEIHGAHRFPPFPRVSRGGA